MRHRVTQSLFACTVLALASVVSASAQEGAGARGIRRPTVITQPGVYVVTNSFAVGAGRPAIDVRSSDVTVDLAGFTLTGPGGKRGIGIRIAEVSNVTIRGGALRSFEIGVQATGVHNARIEHLQITGEDGGGPPPGEIGILLVDSRGVEVRGNQISDTFLGIFVRGEGSGGNRLVDNNLVGGDNSELAICYNPGPGEPSGGPSGDLIYNNLVSRFNRGIAFSADSRGTVVRENSLLVFGAALSEATPGTNVLMENSMVQLN